MGPRWSILLYVTHTTLGVALGAVVIVHVYVAVVLHLRASRAIITGAVDEACVREVYPLEQILGVGGSEPKRFVHLRGARD